MRVYHCQAQETYDDAVQAGHSAFLLEQTSESSDVFRCRVGNLPGETEATIHFSYVKELDIEVDGAVKFTVPAVLNPRFNPGTNEFGKLDELFYIVGKLFC